MAKPYLILVHGRRTVELDIDLDRVDLSLPIAQRSVAQKIQAALAQTRRPRGLIRPGSSNPDRLPR